MDLKTEISKLQNLAVDRYFSTEAINNPRRVYWDPMSWVNYYNDTTVLDKNKKSVKKKLHRELLKVLINDLPEYTISPLEFALSTDNILDKRVKVWETDTTLAKHRFNNSYIEHGLIDWIIPYIDSILEEGNNISLYKNRLFQFINWLVYKDKLTNGYFPVDRQPFYFRLFLRWNWLLYKFSKVEGLSENIRDYLQETSLTRFFNITKLTPLFKNSVGKLPSGLMHYNIAESIAQRTYIIWLYFHEIANDIVLDMEQTGASSDIKEFKTTIVDLNSYIEISGTKNSLNNIQYEWLSLIDFSNYHNNPPGYRPRLLSLSIKTEDQLLAILKGYSVDYIPYFYWSPTVQNILKNLHEVKGQVSDEVSSPEINIAKEIEANTNLIINLSTQNLQLLQKLT